MQKVLLFLILVIIPISALCQTPVGLDLSNYGVRIDADKRLIVVLAALEMARGRNDTGEEVKLINTPLSESGRKFRAQLLADNAGLSEDLRTRISAFVAQYKKRRPNATDAEIVAPFISMSYALSPLPELFDPSFTGDLPGELLDVLDFAPLAREFYRRSGISTKLDEYAKTYRAESDGVLRSSTRDMVSEMLSYLHTRPETTYVEKVKVETPNGKSKTTTLRKIETRDHERRFVIVPELLAPVGTVNFLNIKDDYYVIVPPDKDVSYSDVRRAFLQFVIDPIVLRNATQITAMSETIKRLIEERRKQDPKISPDVFLSISRSLIAAADARETVFSKMAAATQLARERIVQVKTDDEKRAITAELEKLRKSLEDESALELYEAFERGAVLSFYFAEQLKGTEDSGFDIASSMKEMIATIDPLKEKDRLAQNSEARKRAQAARDDRKNRPGGVETMAENPVVTKLREINKSIDTKDYRKAAADLKQMLGAYPAEPRIYYNLGRVASLSAEEITDPGAQAQTLLEAKNAYTNVIKTATASTDRALLSLTYVALGRIYEFYNDPKSAVQLYDVAIKINNVPGGAYQEAIAAKTRLLKVPQ